MWIHAPVEREQDVTGMFWRPQTRQSVHVPVASLPVALPTAKGWQCAGTGRVDGAGSPAGRPPLPPTVRALLAPPPLGTVSLLPGQVVDFQGNLLHG